MIKEQNILLLLDFDGTLAPIVADPHQAALPRHTKLWLKRLLKQKCIKIGIVTGRALPDIQKRVGLKGLIYAANHGMEIASDGRVVLNKGSSFSSPIMAIGRKLQQELAGIPGVIIEKKGTSLSIHYRKVKSTLLQKQVIALVRRVTRGQLRKNRLQITSGKKVVEVRPHRFWNKGKAALWILHNLAKGYRPIYIGDDVTDEDAFHALRSRGITIKIGKTQNTAAQYRMPSFSPQTLSRYFR